MFQRSATQSAKKGTYYKKSLIMFLLTASIPGLITGAIIYFFVIGGMERHLGALHQEQIEERARNVDDQLQYLELNLAHWAFDPRFGSGMRDLDFVYYFQETNDISKTLVVMQGSHPLIKDTELYVGGREKPVLFQPGYRRLTDPSRIREYQRLMDDGRTVYWISDREPITLVHKVPGDSQTPFALLSLTLERERLLNLLRTLTPYNEGITMLLDGEGRSIVSDSTVGAEATETLRERVAKRLLESPNGTFVFETGDVAYTVSYGRMPRIETEWTYVSAAPLTAIVSSAVVTSNIILAVSSLGLLAAVVLSWFASNRMYSPVARMLQVLTGGTPHELKPHGLDEFQFLEHRWTDLTQESRNLQERLREQVPHLRIGFLQQLLQGHLYGYSEEELRERLRKYEWDVAGHSFYLMYIQLTGHDSVSDRFSGDESLVSFSASNIIDELARERFGQYCVIPFYNLSAGLLISCPADEDTERRLRELGDDMTKAINAILKMRVSITIGRSEGCVKRLSDVFMEVERASNYRQFGNKNQIIDLNEATAEPESGESKYPFSLEKDIVQALRMGRSQEAGKLTSAFLQELQTARGSEYGVQQGMLQLYGSLRHAVLESGFDAGRWLGGANGFGELSQMREPGKMLEWMKRHMIEPFVKELEARADAEMKRMVDQTVAYIDENYWKDISLEQCADLAGTTPYTLSKWFKQTTGVNFIDYLTNVRIERAKTLLRESDKKINDIAEAVGYQQSYFNRIFKKQVGVTPGQYRDMT
ncbi:AraC family transcriptional regulator [Paenibacillus sp.]|uniref:AraC family transcriptional regulator n=1 Tax=Paenibacillus sp. TaxID=58172 RepID=UPI002D41BD33|nr:AraC family transcriptional regulator [Paenibacillus sp.]HZG87782.1 AraC family transcriptional regulator [Paenibacillus sp.]